MKYIKKFNELKKWRIPMIHEWEPVTLKYGFQSHTKKMSAEEHIIKYFDCLLGDNLSLINVMKDKEALKNFCDYNKVSQEFVIEVIKNYLKDNDYYK